MAKYLLWFAIAVSLATAGLGFVTKGKIDEKNAQLKSENARATTATNERNKARTELKTAEGKVTEANQALEAQKGELTQKTSDLAAAKEENQKLTTNLSESTAQLAAAKTELEAARTKIADAPQAGTPTTDLSAGAAEVATLKTQLAEAQQVQETYKNQRQQAEEKVRTLTATVARYRAGATRPGMVGRITAVNPGWNFVVINLGDKSGVMMNSPLIVSRGGQTVAQLRITQVEPNSSIADVIPGSLRRGQAVQPGDTVVFAGRQAGDANPEGGVPAGASAQNQ